MSTLQAQSLSPDDLLSAIDRLDIPQLRPFVSQLLARTAHRLAPHLGFRETELLEKINRGFPLEVEERYRELIARRQVEALTSVQREELLELTERAEKLQAERMRHLVDLAQIRGIPLTELMAELGIGPLPVE